MLIRKRPVKMIARVAMGGPHHHHIPRNMAEY
jgi:hypothetical protein